MVIFHDYVKLPEGKVIKCQPNFILQDFSLATQFATYAGPENFCYIQTYGVNPRLINPKRLFNWEGTIYPLAI